MDDIIDEVYHGTDTQSANNIIKTQKFEKSKNEDDWLGTGIYFYDNKDNAILYNIRKYKNNKKEYPTYNELENDRKIIVAQISYCIDDMVDFNDMNNIRKFLGLWKMFYETIKDNEKYRRNNYKDGYMINWFLDNTEYFENCKIITNIFQLDLRFHRDIDEIFNKSTRIGYLIEQKFICVIDDSCIKSIKLYNKKYEKEYNNIKDLTNNILMLGEENEI